MGLSIKKKKNGALHKHCVYISQYTGSYGTYILSCVKIQKITNLLTLGQIKLYMGSVNKNLKKKIINFFFECAKLDFCKINC